MEEHSWSRQSLEQYLSRVEGVENVKVFFDEKNEISEIHVLATSSRQPKQIVRDIESVFITQFGVNVDHRKISVVQLKSEFDSLERRLQIIGIKSTTTKNFMVVEVELEVKEQVFSGKHEGVASDGNRLRIASMATLNAVSKAVPDKIVLALEDVSKCSIAGRQAIVVVVNCLSGFRGELFTGCALLQSDDIETAVKATMDAVNRKLGLLSSLT
jgi:hypothetical protein